MTEIEEFKRIRDWASARGLYAKGDVKTQFVKLSEEFGEVAKAIIQNDDAELKDGIGDMVVVLTNLAHIAGTSIEECIELAWNEIKNRKGSMQNGSFVKEDVKIGIIGSKYYQCIGLKESFLVSWKEHFTIGNHYELIEDDYDVNLSLKLMGNHGVTFHVDPNQFKLLPF